MFRLIKFVVIAVFSSYLLTGCFGSVNRVVINKETVKDKGLVVAKLASTKDGYGKNVVGYGGAYINGKDYDGAIYNDYLVVALKPGKYKLSSAYNSTVNYNTRYTSTYPLNINFDVKPGKVTNIGMVMLVFKEMSGSYAITTIDNKKDVQGYLKKYHSDIFDLIDVNKKFISSEKGYVTGKKLKELKEYIIYDKIKKYYAGENKVTATPGGIFARVYTKNKKKLVIDILEKESANEIISCDDKGPTFICLGRDINFKPVLFKYIKGKIKKISVPGNAWKYFVTSGPNNTITLVDENNKIFRTNNDGGNWKEIGAYIRDMDVKRKGLSYEFYHTTNGVYIKEDYRFQEEYPVIYISNNDAHELIEIPDDLDVNNINDTKTKVYLGPYNTDNNTIIYKFDRATKKWTKTKIENKLCRSVFTINNNDNISATQCRSKPSDYTFNDLYILENKGIWSLVKDKQKSSLLRKAKESRKHSSYFMID